MHLQCKWCKTKSTVLALWTNIKFIWSYFEASVIQMSLFSTQLCPGLLALEAFLVLISLFLEDVHLILLMQTPEALDKLLNNLAQNQNCGFCNPWYTQSQRLPYCNPSSISTGGALHWTLWLLSTNHMHIASQYVFSWGAHSIQSNVTTVHHPKTCHSTDPAPLILTS